MPGYSPAGAPPQVEPSPDDAVRASGWIVADLLFDLVRGTTSQVLRLTTSQNGASRFTADDGLTFVRHLNSKSPREARMLYKMEKLDTDCYLIAWEQR